MLHKNEEKDLSNENNVNILTNPETGKPMISVENTHTISDPYLVSIYFDNGSVFKFKTNGYIAI